MQPRRSRSTAGRLVVSLIVLALAAGVFLYRQPLLDQFTIWQFKPSAAVAALNSGAHFSSQGTHYFYASRPEVEERDAFNSDCNTARGEQTAVLGCYVGLRIFVFDVTDTRLNGIKEVTAAHEMLHAAYDRLSMSERQRVNTLLDAEAQKITDPTFTALLADYAKSEPGERLNELHSLLGTQVDNVGSELEAYYDQYFTDRHALVALYNSYQSVFTNLKDQQEQLVNDLNALSGEINAETASYNQEAQTLNADITRFNNRASSGGFSSQAQFNNERNALVARQADLQQIKQAINAKINEYNDKRQQLLTINAQAEALNRNINSNLTPVSNL